MIKHLLSYSVVHWDQVIRELAAESLGTICKMDIPYTEANVIPKLVKNKIYYIIILYYIILYDIVPYITILYYFNMKKFNNK